MPNVVFDRPPNMKSLELVAQWVDDQFGNLQRALNTGISDVQLVQLHAEPKRVKAGMIVLADGTDWDPGDGAGFYGYRGGAWVKLG